MIMANVIDHVRLRGYCYHHNNDAVYFMQIRFMNIMSLLSKPRHTGPGRIIHID